MSERENELLKRVEQLERQVAELQARPVYVPMPYPVPVAPLPPALPYYPQPWNPYPVWVDNPPLRVTC